MQRVDLKRTYYFLLFVLSLACDLPDGGGTNEAVLENAVIRLAVTPAGGLNIGINVGGEFLSLAEGEKSSFFIIDTAGERIPFFVDSATGFVCGDTMVMGAGRGIRLIMSAGQTGVFSDVKLLLYLFLYDSHPNAVVCCADAEGFGREAMENLSSLRLYSLVIPGEQAGNTDFLTGYRLFQGAAYEWGDWYTKIELNPGYHAPNSYNQPSRLQPFGGGLPVNYLWSRQAGIALALIDTLPRMVSLPVDVGLDGRVQLALESKREFIRVDSTGRFKGIPVMLGVFKGDYFVALREYSSLIRKGGFEFVRSPAGAFEPIWCTWGFRRSFTRDDIYRNIPDLKQMNIPWVVVDDGWQESFGHWPLNRAKFPHGDRDMSSLVDSLHRSGLKAKLWWVPGSMQKDDPLFTKHPEWAILDKSGQPEVSSWDGIRLCPAFRPVVEQQRQLVRRFMIIWGFDAFKMDGECLNAVPPCYNPAHRHQRPEESCEALPGLFAAIREESKRIKPECVLEVCECGLPQSPFNRAYYNQSVASDPTSSDQTRARIKLLKALLGDDAAIYGDFVELSTGPDRGEEYRQAHEPGKDFASTLALGGVIGSKFTSLENTITERTWENFKGVHSHWEKWFKLYNELQLYEGKYLNLYDNVFDIPETHVIMKGDTLYYGIFAESYQGKVRLRGLRCDRRYLISDYENEDRSPLEVTGTAETMIDCNVSDHLLLRAAPSR